MMNLVFPMIRYIQYENLYNLFNYNDEFLEDLKKILDLKNEVGEEEVFRYDENKNDLEEEEEAEDNEEKKKKEEIKNEKNERRNN